MDHRRPLVNNRPTHDGLRFPFDTGGATWGSPHGLSPHPIVRYGQAAHQHMHRHGEDHLIPNYSREMSSRQMDACLMHMNQRTQDLTEEVRFWQRKYRQEAEERTRHPRNYREARQMYYQKKEETAEIKHEMRRLQRLQRHGRGGSRRRHRSRYSGRRRHDDDYTSSSESDGLSSSSDDTDLYSHSRRYGGRGYH